MSDEYDGEETRFGRFMRHLAGPGWNGGGGRRDRLGEVTVMHYSGRPALPQPPAVAAPPAEEVPDTLDDDQAERLAAAREWEWKRRARAAHIEAHKLRPAPQPRRRPTPAVDRTRPRPEEDPGAEDWTRSLAPAPPWRRRRFMWWPLLAVVIAVGALLAIHLIQDVVTTLQAGGATPYVLLVGATVAVAVLCGWAFSTRHQAAAEYGAPAGDDEQGDGEPDWVEGLDPPGRERVPGAVVAILSLVAVAAAALIVIDISRLRG